MIDVKPSKEEVKEVNSLVKKVISKLNLKYTKALLGGSGAKNTWLPGSKEVDIYVMFDYAKYKNKSPELSDLLHNHLKKKFNKISRLHGSRDYFQVFDKGFTIEIIPILDIKKESEAKNITDISQLHVKYVKKYSKLGDEIRLAKTFAKANEVYGAESYIKGFSGYVLECLTIHYGSFNKLVRNVAKWKNSTVIGNKKDVERLNFSKKASLVLIDPVQGSRNAAAALGVEKYNKFIKLCKEYIKKPSEKYFVPEVHKFNSGKNCILLKVKPKIGKRDIVGAKLLKAFEFIKKEFNNNGFVVKKSKWHWDGIALFNYELESSKIKPSYEVKGPPKSMEDHLKKFKRKHKDVTFKGKYSYAKVKRKYTEANKLLKTLLKEKEITARLSSISVC